METGEEIQRRNRLHELDTLLDALEQLNLQESQRLPSGLREDLERAGVEVPLKSNVSALIERVWGLQEQYLHPANNADTHGQPFRNQRFE